MNNKRYIVIKLDFNDDSSNLPEQVGEFPTYDDAKECAVQEMREYCDSLTFIDEKTGETVGPSVYDEDKMIVEGFDSDDEYVENKKCVWNIIETND